MQVSFHPYLKGEGILLRHLSEIILQKQQEIIKANKKI